MRTPESEKICGIDGAQRRFLFSHAEISMLK